MKNGADRETLVSWGGPVEQVFFGYVYKNTYVKICKTVVQCKSE